MALPIIIIDSATGSDVAASGAGPAVALTGTAASTSADGLTVTLDGSPNLSGVATDGSHVIRLTDATAGARNFGKITAVNNTSKTVTVSNAFRASASGLAWAIGGRLASIGSTTSNKLFSNNNLAGDAMPGWVVEQASGHSETLAASLIMRRAGDAIDGPITLRGAAGAAIMPVLTFSNNGNMVVPNAGSQVVRDFEIRNSNATKTASVAVASGGISPRLVGLKVIHATDRPWKGVNNAAGPIFVETCEFANCVSDVVTLTGGSGSRVLNCLIRDNGGHGVTLSGSSGVIGQMVRGNEIVRNSGDGINDIRTGSTVSGTQFVGNTIHGNGGDGIEITSNGTTNTIGLNFTRIENNNLTGNGGYGLNLSGSPTQAALDGLSTAIRNNNFGIGVTSNTSGNCSLATADDDPSNLNVDPGYANAAANDFSVGTAVRGLGFPTELIGGGSGGTRSYVDIGAAQRQEPAAGGLILPRPMQGGYSG